MIIKNNNDNNNRVPVFQFFQGPARIPGPGFPVFVGYCQSPDFPVFVGSSQGSGFLVFVGSRQGCAFEGSLNVTTFRYCCLGFFLAWNPLFIFRYIDASVVATFHVLVNIYFLNFRLVPLIVLRALAHLIYLVIFNNFLVFKFPF